MSTVDLEKMPAMVNVTFRIPLKFENSKQYIGGYRAAAFPAVLPGDNDGYVIHVTKLNEDDASDTIWSGILRVVNSGFILDDTTDRDECFVNERQGSLSNYYHSCASPFVLLLNVASFRAAPEKITIKLTGPFSETY